mgnify:FL=1
MKVITTSLEGCLIIEPKIYPDPRGFFLETFQANKYLEEAGIADAFVQDNHSRSSKGVLRGLHLQNKNPQGKLVRVSFGEVLDVAVDLRKDSSTFGQAETFILSETNFRQLWIPPGFAHGFMVLSDVADFQYKCTQYYDHADELSIFWNDPDLNISWPIDLEPLVSERDQAAQSFQEFCSQC